MIEDVLRGYGDAQSVRGLVVIPPLGGRRPRTKVNGLCDPQVYRNRARTTAIVPMQYSLIRCWIRIEQAIDGLDHAGPVRIRRNAGPSVE